MEELVFNSFSNIGSEAADGAALGSVIHIHRTTKAKSFACGFLIKGVVTKFFKLSSSGASSHFKIWQVTLNVPFHVTLKPVCHASPSGFTRII